MAGRIDKYDPIDGGFRAPLLAAFSTVNTVKGVGLNASGQVIPGAASNTGFVGVICTGTAKNAGDPIDVMTDGEIVEVSGLTAGTVYYLNATGDLVTTAPAAGVNAIRVGWTVEADRLIVRCRQVQG